MYTVSVSWKYIRVWYGGPWEIYMRISHRVVMLQRKFLVVYNTGDDESQLHDEREGERMIRMGDELRYVLLFLKLTL